MIRNLKALGLALVAVFAMSAMATSVASAEFTTTEGATLTATDNGGLVFTVTGQKVTCNNAVFTATNAPASFESIGVAATYHECTGAGVPAKVTGFGQYGETDTCEFVLWTDGTADLECEGTADVTIDAGPCVVHVPEQTNLGTITYTTGVVSGKHDLTLDINIKEITSTHTDGFLCPFPNTTTLTHDNSAELHGTVTAHATSGGVRVDLTHDL